MEKVFFNKVFFGSLKIKASNLKIKYQDITQREFFTLIILII